MENSNKTSSISQISSHTSHNQNLRWKLGQQAPSFGFILGVWLKNFFFRNKTFFFKIESWNFQHLFEIEFLETSQNFNSSSLFRQFLFSFFLSVVWLSWSFVRFHKILTVSAFYLEKHLFLNIFKLFSISKQKSFVTNSILSEGFVFNTEGAHNCSPQDFIRNTLARILTADDDNYNNIEK